MRKKSIFRIYFVHEKTTVK